MPDQFIDYAKDGFAGMIVDGIPRLLNLAPPKLKAMPRLQDTQDLVPRSLWSTESVANLAKILPRHNQLGVGQCEPCSEIEAIEFLRLQWNLPNIKLSPSFLYALINRDVDQGASIGDGYPMLQQFGTCRDELCPTGHFYTRAQLSQAMFKDARNYQVLFARHCPSFDEIGTAIHNKLGLVTGVAVGPQFGKLDSDGCYPPTKMMPNHAVSRREIRRRSNGDPYFWGPNHWGDNWGIDGEFGFDEEAYEAESYHDAICFEVITVDASVGLPSFPKATASVPFFVTRTA